MPKLAQFRAKHEAAPRPSTIKPSDDEEDASKGKAKFHVEVTPVVVDLTEGSQVIIKSGLKPGDSVVIDGQEKLKDQSNVNPRQGATAGTGPSTQPLGGSTPAPGGKHGPQVPLTASPDDKLDTTKPHHKHGPAAPPADESGDQQ